MNNTAVNLPLAAACGEQAGHGHDVGVADVTACILAGGLGTRLREVVADKPKVLASVGGKAFLAYLLDWLQVQGVRRVVLCIGHLGGMIRSEFGEQYGDLGLCYSEETVPLGTGGALFKALSQVETRRVLLLNGDSYCGMDLRRALAWHAEMKAESTIVLARVPDGSRYGRVNLDDASRVVGFIEKDGNSSPAWINSGVVVFETSVLRLLRRGGTCSLERDILGNWSGAGLYGYQQSGAFLDIGIPSDYAKAEAFFQEVSTGGRTNLQGHVA